MGAEVIVPTVAICVYFKTRRIAKTLDQNNRQIQDHWQWMDFNCRRLSYQEYQIINWPNKIPWKNLIKAFGKSRVNQNFSYQCGMHALNLSWLMLGNDEQLQWKQNRYPHKSILGLKVGLHGKQFAQKCIKPYFKSYEISCGDSMPCLFVSKYFCKNYQ